jgi:hypothetical protein
VPQNARLTCIETSEDLFVLLEVGVPVVPLLSRHTVVQGISLVELPLLKGLVQDFGRYRQFHLESDRRGGPPGQRQLSDLSLLCILIGTAVTSWLCLKSSNSRLIIIWSGET